MDVFAFREQLIENYATYIRSFIHIRDSRIGAFVQQNLDNGVLWPDPLIQLNPSFEPGALIDDLVHERILHEECARDFRINKGEPQARERSLRLYRHQEEAIRVAHRGHNYVLTTG